MEYLYTGIVFVMSIIEASLFYNVICGKELSNLKWKKIVPFIFLYVILICSIKCNMIFFIQMLIFWGGYYFAALLFARIGRLESIGFSILAYILCGTMEQILCGAVWRNIIAETTGFGPLDILSCATVIVIMLFLKKVMISQKPWWFLIPLGCIIIIGLSYTAYLTDRISSEKEREYIMVVLLSAVIGICMIIVIVARIIWQKDAFRRQAELEKLYSEQQRDYFDIMMKKEEETKRFRHDIMNHFICVMDDMENGRYEDARRYLADLIDEMNEIRGMQYDLGNEVINVLIHFYIAPIREKGMVTIEGYLGKMDNITQMDMCTIFSNVFKNAAEAAEKTGNIEIHVIRKEKYAQVKIRNTYEHQIFILENGNPKSHKKDFENHGMGLENVRRTVKKYNGEFQYKIEENWFEVEIILPV